MSRRISFYKKEKPDSLEKLKSHINILRREFFDKIQLKSDDTVETDGMEIEIPNLPDGYEILYQRRAVQNTFHVDGGKSLKISEAVVHKDILECNHEESSVFIYCKSDIVSEMLKTREWEPEALTDDIEKLLIFSNAIKEYIK